MDRYTKVDQKKPNIPINENEIRITSQGLVRNYISYATTRIQERRGKEIVLKAMGQAISKTVAIAEFLKRNIPRLHQDTAISSISITDIWEPIEEGLLPVEMTRQVSMISITLSTKELNTNSPGYQAPVFVERSKPQYNSYQRQPRQTHQSYNEESYGGNYRGRGQGGGGVRGRGWNSRYGGYQGGDGYRNYQGDNYGGNNYQGGGRGYGNGNNYQGGGRGYGNDINYQGGGRGYGNGNNYQSGSRGYGNGNYRGGRGYGNYQGGNGEYGNNYQGGGEYRNYQDNNGYSNRGRGGGRGGNASYRGGGYMRGGGGGGRGGGLNGRGGRGRMDGTE